MAEPRNGCSKTDWFFLLLDEKCRNFCWLNSIQAITLQSWHKFPCELSFILFKFLCKFFLLKGRSSVWFCFMVCLQVLGLFSIVTVLLESNNNFRYYFLVVRLGYDLIEDFLDCLVVFKSVKYFLILLFQIVQVFLCVVVNLSFVIPIVLFVIKHWLPSPRH